MSDMIDIPKGRMSKWRDKGMDRLTPAHTLHRTPAHTSYRMSRVRSRNTSPEVIVRKIAHELGFRFRLHRKDLVGTPDLVFPRLRSVIFVNGCFWHRHPGCRRASTPATRTEYWLARFARNVERDAIVQRQLESQGWRVLVLWECEAHDPQTFRKRIREFLTGGGPRAA
jgi:DNA mismatch endonuclease (patch repair protein)